ncbi:MAG TPA: beta-ketoacyl synthase N-terminal-like domain-containing protein [Kofleriaceae bacterium]|nr:beta-ketoacyl synthase N-terminal-like domain-containing protein [Kofleriaceae bacterium]
MTTRAVAVTGLGMITSLGVGTTVNWKRMLAGESGIKRISRFCTEGLPVHMAAAVELPGLGPEALILERSRVMGDVVVDEALAQAGVPAREPFPGQFYIAPPCHDNEWPALLAAARLAGAPTYDRIYDQLRKGARTGLGYEYLGAHYAARHGLDRLPMCMTTACASGSTAVQFAIEAIRRGEHAMALVLGSDGPVRPEMLARFALLSALSTANEVPERASRPFSRDRDGFVLGEGAAALVLEDPAHARKRGAEILAYVLGSGDAGDSFHRTRSNPSATPIADCITRALADAGVDRTAVDHVNAHGTSTPENDKMESLGLGLALGDHAAHVPVTSIKSMVGHTIHAAGAVEAAITVMTVMTGLIPPTINHDVPDPELRIAVVSNTSREHPTRVAISNSFGFGGQNVCLVIGKA